jgi:hypothetical protein
VSRAVTRVRAVRAVLLGLAVGLTVAAYGAAVWLNAWLGWPI